MHAVAFGRGGGAVGGGADERMRELDPRTDGQQAGIQCRPGRPHVEAERPGGAVEQDGIAQGLSGCGEDEQERVGRQQQQAPDVALLDLAHDGLRARKTESPGQLRGAPRPRELEQRERVAVALRDELVADRAIQRHVHVVEQQCTRVAVAESVDRHLGQLGEDVLAAARPNGAHERDALGEQAAGDEADDLGGRGVEPLRVVDEAHERLSLGDLGDERERCDADEEAIGRRAGAAAEHRRQRVALRCGQPLEMVEHGRAELVESAVGELHLRLDSHGLRDVPAGDTAGEVGEQSALSDAGLSAQHDDAAATVERVGQEPVERFTFGTTSQELHRRPPYKRAPLDRRS